MLSAFGGLLGVIAALAFAKGLGALIGDIMSADFVAPVRLWSVLMAVLVAGAVGLVAGLFPARRAAALDPVTALRAE